MRFLYFIFDQYCQIGAQYDRGCDLKTFFISSGHLKSSDLSTCGPGTPEGPWWPAPETGSGSQKPASLCGIWTGGGTGRQSWTPHVLIVKKTGDSQIEHRNVIIKVLPLTGGPVPARRRWGRRGYRQASWRPSNTRRTPPTEWPGPRPSQSWRTRRRGRRCRTGTGWGICGRGSPHHRRQTGTLHQDTEPKHWRC